MADKMVFPGGALDPADHVAAGLFPPPAALAEHLGRQPRERDAATTDHALGSALAMAALRELAEETGVAPIG
ncbi:MAG: hypothetical protein AAF899_11995, partial [Pseudomonadota bacterium]